MAVEEKGVQVPRALQTKPLQEDAILAPLCGSHMVQDVSVLLQAGRRTPCLLCRLLDLFILQ